MRTRTQVVIIGGGIMGTSLLYHLAKEGWTDCVLVEKAALTSGSTWHAAGLIAHLSSSLSLAQITSYGVNLYPELEAETGQSVTWHGCGGLYLAYTDDELAPLRAAAELGRTEYATALLGFLAEHQEMGRLLPIILYETLGPTLQTADGDDAAGAAAVWGLSQTAAGFWDASIRRAGIGDPDGGNGLGDALFDAVLANPQGITFSVDGYDETMRRVLTFDGKVNLVIPSLLEEFDGLADEPDPVRADPEFPLVLAAGERRSSTANTIFRDPGWRKNDQQGALRLSPSDADALGLESGDRARIYQRTYSEIFAAPKQDVVIKLERVAEAKPNPKGANTVFLRVTDARRAAWWRSSRPRCCG